MTRLTSISFPLANYFEISGTGPGTHLAVDYEDTTEGAVHCFQDEYGNLRLHLPTPPYVKYVFV